MVEEGKPILWNPSKCISWMVWVFTYEFSELWRRRIWLKRRRDSPPPKEDRCNLFSRWSYTDRPCRWLKKNKLSLERLKIDAVCKQFLRLKLEEQRLEGINYPYKHASNIRNDDMIVSKWIAKKEIAFAIRSPVRRRIWQNWSTSMLFHFDLSNCNDRIRNGQKGNFSSQTIRGLALNSVASGYNPVLHSFCKQPPWYRFPKIRPSHTWTITHARLEFKKCKTRIMNLIQLWVSKYLIPIIRSPMLLRLRLPMRNS